MAETTIYEAVLPVIIGQLETPMEVNELSKTLDVSKTQLNNWIKKAVSEGRIRKLLRPIRYEEIKMDSYASQGVEVDTLKAMFFDVQEEKRPG